MTKKHKKCSTCSPSESKGATINNLVNRSTILTGYQPTKCCKKCKCKDKCSGKCKSTPPGRE